MIEETLILQDESSLFSSRRRPWHGVRAQGAAIEQLAAAASVWLDAPEPVLIARAGRRRNNPSDAGANVIRMQSARGAGEIGWCRIDASLSAPSVLSRATDRVREQLHGALNDVADEVQ